MHDDVDTHPDTTKRVSMVEDNKSDQSLPLLTYERRMASEGQTSSNVEEEAFSWLCNILRTSSSIIKVHMPASLSATFKLDSPCFCAEKA